MFIISIGFISNIQHDILQYFIQNQQTNRQGNSIHDVLGMPFSGRRLSRMNPSLCHGSKVLLRIPHDALDTHDTVSPCHYICKICKMFPTVSVLRPDQLDDVTPIVTPSFIHPVPYLPCLRENVGGKAPVVWLHSLSGWFTTRNSEDKKLLAPQMSDHYLKQKRQLTK